MVPRQLHAAPAEGQQADRVRRCQPVDETCGGVEDRLLVTLGDALEIGHQDDDATGDGARVRGDRDRRIALHGAGPVIRSVEVREGNAPLGAVDPHHEVFGPQIADGPAVLVDHPDVEANQLDAAAERRLLLDDEADQGGDEQRWHALIIVRFGRDCAGRGRLTGCAKRYRLPQAAKR